jgi:mRNA-degrading endonuclease YafQ of YafQ-DinJ toxin-antitoxin module
VLDYVIEELAVPKLLPENYQDHPLRVEYSGYRVIVTLSLIRF